MSALTSVLSVMLVKHFRQGVLLLTVLLSVQSWGQLTTWVDDIAPMVHTHCARCHHTGGAGPFPLLTYEDVFFTANMDVHVMQDGGNATLASRPGLPALCG